MNSLSQRPGMKRRILALCLAGIAGTGFCMAEAQATSPFLIQESGFVPVVLDNQYKPSFTPPPPSFTDYRARRAPAAQVHISFNGSSCRGTLAAWPAEAMTSFQYASDIWASLVNSTVAIEVAACWRTDLSTSNLGTTSTNLVQDPPNAPVKNTYYPLSLSNHLAGTRLVPTVPDMIVDINGNSNWYLGTDGNPGYKVDLVTVVLHEIAHGLGFIGAFTVSSGSGSLRFPNPAIYDRFTADGSGTSLLSYPSPSTALGSVLTGGGIYFTGAAARKANGGLSVKLYAPSTWVSGSSYTHLDEGFNSTQNAVMTYSIGFGEAIHTPGPVTSGILTDIGWQLNLTEPPFAPANLTASGLSSTQVSLTWQDTSTNEDGFRLERTLRSSVSWQLLVSLPAGSASYVDATAAAGTGYLYRIQAFNQAGSSSYSNLAEAVTTSNINYAYKLYLPSVIR